MEAHMNRRWNTIAALLIMAFALVAVAGCSPSAGTSLNGTKWRLSGWTISSIDPASVTITMRFADGQISGNSGVNSYGGPYTAGPGNAFSVGAVAMTEMAGPDLNMRAESAFHTLLAQARSYKIEGAKLTLFDANGNDSMYFEVASE
jgi:heat shock protein HslJ